MSRFAHARAVPTVELSVAATSEELALLAADAQRRHMSLKDYLRLQLVAVAKLAAKAQREAALAAAAPAASEPAAGPRRPVLAPAAPAFLP